MKLGKKKKENEEQPIEAGVIQAQAKTQQDGLKMDARVKAFETQYNNMFSPQDFAVVRSEAMTCNLLFAIWAELRELKELVKMDASG